MCLWHRSELLLRMGLGSEIDYGIFNREIEVRWRIFSQL
ncbi:hypothetical protein FM112_03545 [Gulosibacter sp. 10]|nr:hypothetical protein FM112_03545 [Gulosibacter sp. 10]